MGAKRYAEQLDERLATGLSTYAAEFEEGEAQRVGAEAWSAAMAKNSFTKQYEIQVQAEEKHDQEITRIAEEKDTDRDGLKLDDLPDDLALDDIAVHPYPPLATLTLENAVILVLPFWREDPIGTVRIQISQIGAWWTDIGAGPEVSEPDG
ncbi:MAG TPA: hypothetical protein VGN84_11225 [Solirubrobacterales bacterium]|nr:hypothetical protein [Solirubrobacterales bacterium]